MKKYSLFLVPLLFTIATTSAVHAQLFSWSGGGSSNNWSEAANWGGVVSSSGSADLLFGNSSNHTPFNNLGTFDLELLFISGSTPYTFSGNTLRFSATTPELTASSGTHAINNPIAMTQPLEVQVNSGASLDLNGKLSGAADITKIQGGLLVLDGNNGSWTGDLDIQAGTVRFDPGDALSTTSALHVAAGATADFSPESEGLGAIFGAGQVLLGSTIDLFANYGTNASFNGVMSGVNAHFRKQGSATMSLTSGADVNLDAITAQNGTLSVGSGAVVTTTGTTNVDLGSTLSLSAGSTYNSSGSIISEGTLTTSGGDISTGQFKSITIREFGIWNLDDTGTESTTFTQTILNVNDSAVLRLFGDFALDASFFNIEDTDLLQLSNTDVDVLAENNSSLIIGALTGMADSNTVDLDRNATFELRSGSTLRTNWLRLGFNADSQAMILLNGQGTLLDASYAVDVGYEGPGELVVSNGARIESFFGAVGRDPQGSGLLTISGTGSSGNPSEWIVESHFDVGLSSSSSGEVQVLSGAHLSADVLGVGGGGRGALTIDGTDTAGNPSQVNVSTELQIRGTVLGGGDLMTISAGGAVEVTGEVLVGNQGGAATLRITDAESSFLQTGNEMTLVGVIGTPPTTTALVDVQGGSFTTGTGGTHIFTAGSLNVSGGITTLNGPLTVDGGTVELSGGSLIATTITL